ncbi:MAG: hypothetical protein AB4426_11090 [Xenococcaceae cyanobacterium]
MPSGLNDFFEHLIGMMLVQRSLPIGQFCHVDQIQYLHNVTVHSSPQKSDRHPKTARATPRLRELPHHDANLNQLGLLFTYIYKIVYIKT